MVLHKDRSKPLSFSREICLLIIGIFSFIVAFAWSSAFVNSIQEYLKGWDEVWGLFVYAICTTIVAVLILFFVVRANCYFNEQ